MEITITKSTTVKELKDQFHNEYEGTLRIYDGIKKVKAEEDVLLVSIGAKEGTYGCRGSKTVGEFCYDLFKKFNLIVKVEPSDKWVILLYNIPLAAIKDYSKAIEKNSKNLKLIN